jgi:hypothetical protein
MATIAIGWNVRKSAMVSRKRRVVIARWMTDRPFAEVAE